MSSVAIAPKLAPPLPHRGGSGLGVHRAGSRPARRGGGARSCPTGLLIDGAFVAATEGRTLAVEDPATGRAIAEVADASPADCMAALEAAVAAQASWAESAPARSLAHPAPGGRRPARAGRGDGAGPHRRDGKAPRRVARRGRVRRRLPGVVRRGGRADRRAHQRALPTARASTWWCAPRSGPCLIVTPWNFPLAVPARGIGPALAAGCTRRPAALVADAAVGARARADPDRGRPAGGRPQHRRLLRGRGHRPAARRRAHPQADLHRLRGRRPPPDRSERRAGAARLGRARWLRPVPGLRRRRHGRRGRGRPVGQDAKRRGGLHRGQPLLRRAVGLRRVHRAAWPSGSRRCGSGRGTRAGVGLRADDLRSARWRG